MKKRKKKKLKKKKKKKKKKKLVRLFISSWAKTTVTVGCFYLEYFFIFFLYEIGEKLFRGGLTHSQTSFED